MAKNEKNAKYQKERSNKQRDALKKLREERFQRLVRYSESIKPLLEKYKPGYVPPEPEKKPEPAKKEPPRQRKKWILGVD